MDSTQGPSTTVVTDFCAGEIAAHQDVIFHHGETTRRAINRWGL